MANAEAASAELARQLLHPASSLQVGLLMLERDLQASVESALLGSVTRLWGIQDVSARVHSDPGGRSIVIALKVVGLRHDLNDTCHKVIEVVRTNVGVNGDPARVEEVVGYFYPSLSREKFSTKQLQRDLLERMRVHVQFEIPTHEEHLGKANACSSSLLVSD